MQRTATALIALLAVLALAGAAGSLAGVDRSQPTLHGGDELGERTPAPAGTYGNDSGTPTGTESGAQVAGGGDEPGSSADDGGISSLFLALFVGALLVSACLALLLTGDDERAAPPEDDADSDRDPRPTVSLSYDAPGDDAVVRAWRRLTEETGADDARTPGETARRATEQGLSRGVVTRLTDAFRAVRYGDRSVDEDRERAAQDALTAVEEGDG